MKTLLLSSLIFLAGFQTPAQNFSFEFLGNGTTAQYMEGYDLAVTPSGYTATFMANDQNSGLFHINHYTTDTAGVLQNLFEYRGAADSVSLDPKYTETLPDGTQIISGKWNFNSDAAYNKPFVMRIASDGSVIWARSIENLSHEPAFVKVLANGSILCIFRYTILGEATYKIYCKIDSNGNFSNFMQYPLGFDHPRKVVSNNDGTFDVVTAEGNLVNFNNDLSAINWTRKYFVEGGITFNRTQNGDYIFASLQTIFGHGTIFRTDSVGNVIWAKQVETFEGIAGQNPFHVIHFDYIEEDSEGYIHAAAYQVNSFRTMHINLDADGNFVSTHSVTTTHNKSIRMPEDRMLQVSLDDFPGFNFQLEMRNLGQPTPCDNETMHNIFEGDAMELDPVDISLTPIEAFETEELDLVVANEPGSVNQVVFCDLTTAVEKVSDLELIVYPNPTKGLIRVNADQKIDRIHLLNSLGQRIVTAEETTIDISALPAGYYLLEVVTAHRSYFRKIVKE